MVPHCVVAPPMDGRRERNSPVERAAAAGFPPTAEATDEPNAPQSAPQSPEQCSRVPPRRADYTYLLSVSPGAVGVCVVCGRCLARARMSSATPGVNELCGLCRDIGRVANAVASSTLSADEEDAARLLLSRVCALLERRRDGSCLRLCRGGQRSGPYEAADDSEASVAERVDPASSAGGQ